MAHGYDAAELGEGISAKALPWTVTLDGESGPLSLIAATQQKDDAFAAAERLASSGDYRPSTVFAVNAQGECVCTWTVMTSGFYVNENGKPPRGARFRRRRA